MSKKTRQIYAVALVGILCIQPIYAQSFKAVKLEEAAISSIKVADEVQNKVEVNVSKDAFVRDGSNQDINYGTSNNLEVKTALTGTGYNRKVYLGFDLGVYSQNYIKQATVRLYLADVFGNNDVELNKRPSDIVSLYEVDNVWDEQTITWANAPIVGTKVADFDINRRETKKYIDVDITTYINQKLSEGKNLGEISFALQIDYANRHDNGGEIFASKESGNPVAQIIIEEGLPAPHLAVIGITDGMKVKDESVKVEVEASSINESIPLEIDVTVNGQPVTGVGHTYEVPLNIGANTIVVQVADPSGNVVEKTYKVIRVTTQSITYYVDSINGNDDNDGTSPETAWKSLDKLNEQYFMPGNKVLFRRGGVWSGQFKPQGSGIEGYPVVIDTYGEGAKPIINGDVSSKDTNSKFPEGAVHLEGVSYYEVSNLEVTNRGQTADDEAYRGGIVSLALGAGNVEHIYIKDCYVHDIDNTCESSRKNKMSGGILILGDTRDKQGNNTGIKTTYDDIIVENNHVKDVAIEGIRTKTWHNGTDAPDKRNSNVIFRNNLIEEVHGDGIVISEIAENGLVEKNIVRKHSKCNTNLNYAGCWVWDSTDTVFQYNEVYDGVDGFMDGEAFDIDINCSNVTYQYNYSHNNTGGFCLFMNGLKENNVFRYNLSKNDGNGTEIFHYLPNSEGETPEIYNNTIYIGEGIDVKYLFHQTVGGRKYPWAHFYNNIVQVDGNLQNFAGDRNGNTTEAARGTYKNNIMYPVQFANLPGAPLEHPGLITENPMLLSPEKENILMNTWVQEIWDQNIANFQVAQDSPAIDAGVEVANNGGKDIYGNPLYSGGKADIGAHEVVVKTTNPQITMPSKGEAEGGQTFAVTVGIDNVDRAVYAEDLVVNYDKELFELVRVEGIGKTQVIDTKEEDGKVRVLLATEQGLNDGEQSIKVHLAPARVNREVTSMITISEVNLGIVNQGISEVVVAEGAASTITIKPADTQVDKAQLREAIEEAQRLSDAAVVGDKIGEYPQVAKDALDTAITIARQVVQVSENQAEIDATTQALRTAINTFKDTQIKGNQEDTNEDGVIDVADLALVAYYYQSNSESPNWEQASKADINKDNKVDVSDLSLVARKILNK